MLTTKRNFSIGKEGKKKSYEGTERTRADFYFKNQSRKICDWGKKNHPRAPQSSHTPRKRNTTGQNKGKKEIKEEKEKETPITDKSAKMAETRREIRE